MSAPAIDPDAPAALGEPRHRALRAVVWATATGAFAGLMWPFELAVSLALYGREASTYALTTWEAPSVLLILAGGFCGCGVGAIVGALSGNGRLKPTLLLGAIGTACGAAGGGLTVPVMRAGASLMDPLLSSALLWALIGALAGLTGSLSLPDAPHERRRTSPVLAALGWGLAGAACAGGSWGGSWYAVGAWIDVRFVLLGSEFGTAGSALMLAGVGIIYGGCAGATVGLFRWRDRTGAFFLISAGALTAAFGYGLSVLAVALTRDSLDPLLSSSLAMASVGFFAGLHGYLNSHRSTPPPPDEPAYEEEDAAPGAKVEWLLREPKRSWRLPRPLVRVLPVFAVAVGAGVGAACVSSLALFAVALLGFAVARVLYRQEQRLDALEHQSRAKRDS